ncbi:MAG TPA: cache domain-containing protein [Vicinamibacteria bacterium]|nr:cache domain-containing protein [Vicinamibacteria bacterium]
MSKRHYEVDPRILTVFFFVAIPFLAFGALVVMNLARGHLQNVTGQNLEQRAGEARQLVERYVLGQFSHLHLITLDPQLQAAVSAPPRGGGPDELRRLDQAWATGDAALVASVAGSPLAARLREVGQTQPALRLLQVVDARGRLLATTARGGRLWNGDTAWFRAFGDTEIGGAPYVVDIVSPPGGAGAMFEIDVPIRDSTGGHPLGAVRALYDASDLYSVLASVRVGRTGHAVLMRSTDGLVLAADESSRVLKDRFPGFEYIGVARRENRGFWTVPSVHSGEVEEPPRIVGFASVEQVPSVEWTVGVEQDLEEAVSPIKSIGWYLFAHVIGVVVFTVLLALYFTSQLEAPVIEEALHLHEEHVPAAYRAAS